MNNVYIFFRNNLEVVRAEMMDAVLVVVVIDHMKYFGTMPNNIEKD